MDDIQLTRTLARASKRLNFWRSQLGGTNVSGDASREIEALLNTYTLLMAKLSKKTTSSEQDESVARLHDVERRLTSLFEAKRLATSDLNDSSF